MLTLKGEWGISSCGRARKRICLFMCLFCLLFLPGKRAAHLLIAWKLYSVWRFLFWAAALRDCGFSELIPELCYGVDCVSLQASPPCHQHFQLFISAQNRAALVPWSSSPWTCLSLLQVIKEIIKHNRRASLVVQWLRICLPVQGTRVRALVWEDPTCHGAAGPVSHNYWACASGACAPQRERPR